MALIDDDAHADDDDGGVVEAPSAQSIRRNASIPEKLDAQGFASYLAPYALAVLASLAVTAAFIRFVLMSF